MPIDARGFQLEADPLGRFALGQKLGRQQLQLQQQEQIKQLLGQAQSPGQALVPPQPGVETAIEAPPTQADLIQQARQIDPVMAEQQLKALGLDSAGKRAEASRFAAEVQSLPPEMQAARINQRVVELRSQGRDPSDTEQLLTMPPDQRNQALTGVQLLDLSTKERFGVQAKLAKGAPGVSEVQSSKILDDGTTQIVRKDGTVEIIEPSKLGKELVRRGTERGVDLQQRRAQARETGKGTAKFTDKVFEKTDKMRANNNVLRQVIESVRGGAETGPLSDKLPSFRAESIRLGQLKNQLGLDVVGSVTFGALSEGELRLAMSTALPTTLQGPDLIKWADDKIKAQEKLASYLEEQGIFLSQRGKNRADWIKSQRQDKKEATSATTPPPAEASAQPPVDVQRETSKVGRFNVRVKQ